MLEERSIATNAELRAAYERLIVPENSSRDVNVSAEPTLDRIVWKNGTTRTRTTKGDRLHSFNDAPSLVVRDKQGRVTSKTWHKEGFVHRDHDKPAHVEYYVDGRQKLLKWKRQGHWHQRDNGKANFIEPKKQVEQWYHSKGYLNRTHHSRAGLGPAYHDKKRGIKKYFIRAEEYSYREYSGKTGYYDAEESCLPDTTDNKKKGASLARKTTRNKAPFALAAAAPSPPTPSLQPLKPVVEGVLQHLFESYKKEKDPLRKADFQKCIHAISEIPVEYLDGSERGVTQKENETFLLEDSTNLFKMHRTSDDAWEAYAIISREDGYAKTLLLEGSLIRKETQPWIAEIRKDISALRTDLFNSGILYQSPDNPKCYVLAQTYEFNSPGGAACFVSGMSVNGRDSWRDRQGKSINKLEKNN
jgi:hypothetical protein